jgi:hypothetical protein
MTSEKASLRRDVIAHPARLSTIPDHQNHRLGEAFGRDVIAVEAPFESSKQDSPKPEHKTTASAVHRLGIAPTKAGTTTSAMISSSVTKRHDRPRRASDV